MNCKASYKSLDLGRMPLPMALEFKLQEARLQMQGGGPAATGAPMNAENTQDLEAELQSDAKAADSPSM